MWGKGSVVGPGREYLELSQCRVSQMANSRCALFFFWAWLLIVCFGVCVFCVCVFVRYFQVGLRAASRLTCASRDDHWHSRIFIKNCYFFRSTQFSIVTWFLYSYINDKTMMKSVPKQWKRGPPFWMFGINVKTRPGRDWSNPKCRISIFQTWTIGR